MKVSDALHYANSEHADGWVRGQAKDELRGTLVKMLPVLKFNELIEDAINETEGLNVSAQQAEEIMGNLRKELDESRK